MNVYKGVIVRDNYMDEYIVDEMDKDYKYILSKVKGLKVLDIGANLGAFTRKALDNGAASVVSVEPENDNYELLLLNTKAYDNVVTIKAAVTNSSGDNITLYVNEGNNKGLHTIRENWLASSRPDCTEQIVGTIAIGQLLAEFRPDVLKIDIEGGEELIAETLKSLPSYVKYVAIEFDTITDTYLSTIEGLLNSYSDAERNKFFTGERND